MGDACSSCSQSHPVGLNVDGALLVYDITDEESFLKVKTWVKELRRIVGDTIDIVIAGNKVDLHRNRKVNEADAVHYAKSVGATHYNTSAKLNRGLEDVFIDLSKRMLVRGASRSKKNKVSGLIADDDDERPASTNPHAVHRASLSVSAATDISSRANSTRARDGGRGNTIQIVDDNPSSSSVLHGGGLRPGQASASAKKSGCC
jgi:hypothetical protein